MIRMQIILLFVSFVGFWLSVVHSWLIVVVYDSVIGHQNSVIYLAPAEYLLASGRQDHWERFGQRMDRLRQCHADQGQAFEQVC